MITINKRSLDKAFTFSGGERQIRLFDLSGTYLVEVKATVRSTDDLIDLLLVTNAIANSNTGSHEVVVYLHYLPYARQDRVCYSGEANGSEVMRGLLGLIKADNIYVADVHSQQDLPLNVTEITCLDIFEENEDVLKGITALVAPDKGSEAKVREIGHYFNIPVIYCNKTRDTSDGQITGIEISSGHDLVRNGRILVIDDICDGGATFNYLAEMLRTHGTPESLGLYVTHGIFSKGVEELYSNYDTICTTDSFFSPHQVVGSGYYNRTKVLSI